MKVRCYLREIRGRRGLRDIADAAGVNRGTLSMVERGRILPKDEWLDGMEKAYGEPRTSFYPLAVLTILEIDEEDEVAA